MTDLHTIRSRHCTVAGSTGFTAKDGSTAALFWGQRQSGDRPTETIFFHHSGDWSEVRALENTATAGAEARADVIIAKGRL